MTNQETLPLSQPLNADHMAFFAQAQKVTGKMIPNPGTDTKRKWITGKRKCCATVNRLPDEFVKRCPVHPNSFKGPGSPPDNTSESDRNLWMTGKN